MVLLSTDYTLFPPKYVYRKLIKKQNRFRRNKSWQPIFPLNRRSAVVYKTYFRRRRLLLLWRRPFSGKIIRNPCEVTAHCKTTQLDGPTFFEYQYQFLGFIRIIPNFWIYSQTMLFSSKLCVKNHYVHTHSVYFIDSLFAIFLLQKVCALKMLTMLLCHWFVIDERVSLSMKSWVMFSSLSWDTWGARNFLGAVY